MSKLKVFITRPIGEPVVDFLRERYEVSMGEKEGGLAPDELRKRAQGCSAVLVTADKIDEAFCAAVGSNCRIIANHGVGYNNIDVAAATKHGIYVTNTPDVVTEDTADLAMGLLLAVARRFVECDKYVRAGDWKKVDVKTMFGSRVSGKTVGIIGGGRIGLAFAKRAKSFGMNILYTANSRKSDFEEEVGGVYVDKETLLKEADFVSLHVPLQPSTHHLIGAKELELMKPTAFLINTARGPVVDEKALVAALQAGKISGAGLDVFEHEPDIEAGLTSLGNVVLTPHIGTLIKETRIRMGMLCANNMIAALEGKEPPNCLNPEAKKSDR
jgi:lactate dehydrogenase-like 2-hydroxyacid dehydrogenase